MLLQSVARNRIVAGIAALVVALGLVCWWLVGSTPAEAPAEVLITPPTPVLLAVRDVAEDPTAPPILAIAGAPSAQPATPTSQPAESAAVLLPSGTPTLPSHLEMPADVTVPVAQAAPANTSVAKVTPLAVATLLSVAPTPITSITPIVSIASITPIASVASVASVPAGSIPQATATAVKPRSTPTSDGTPILPTGAKYGDHNPNVPGRVVRITAPSIHLDTKVYEVYVKNSAWEVADYAAGHQFNSANPGDGGNIVISGHNNWHGEVFRYLENLTVGDDIHLFTQAGKEYVYTVRLTEKLKEAGASYQQRLQNGKVMEPTPQEQLTLITCWPYTTFTHRLIIIADPVK